MDTKYTTEGREWTAGERVIIVSTSRANPAPRVRPIESVAEKSFVVDGDRYMKDKLQYGVPTRWNGTGWDRYSVSVIPMDHPDVSYLLAQRAVHKQRRLLDVAHKEFTRNPTATNAETLRDETAEFVTARKLFDAELQKRADGGR